MDNNNGNNNKSGGAPDRRNAPRRKASKPGYAINLCCIVAAAAVFFLLAACNLFQPERPTVSEAENRALKKMPEFSFSALFDGSYFSDLSAFVSDTFWQREWLVGVSRVFDRLRGVSYVVDGVEWIIDDGRDPEETTEDEETAYIPVVTWDDDTSEPDITTSDPEIITSDQTEITSTPPDDTGTGTGEVTGELTGEQTTLPEVTTPEPFEVRAIKLSIGSMEIVEGGSGLISASLTTSGEGVPPAIVWTVSDTNVLSLTSDGSGSASVYAKKAGRATVTASCAGLVASCEITVKADSGSSQQQPDDVEVIASNTTYFVYQNAIYPTVSHGDSTLKAWAQSYGGLVTQFKRLFPDSRISIMIVPESSMLLDPAKVKKAGRNQGEEIAVMAANLDQTAVNFVQIYPELAAHADEHLFFKSDNHWSGLGAYYGYSGFMKSIGETPYPLSAFTKKTLTENFKGYLANKFNKNIYDVLDVYVPVKTVSTRVTYAPADKIAPTTYSKVIWESHKSYMAFLSGDRPLIQINVPDNPQDKNVLVIKDSFGDAFAPYLTMHYGNITVIDPREYFKSFAKTQTLQVAFKDQQFTDIIFVADLLKNQSNWVKNFLYPLIGVN
ncbi:MAG: hypothetical protein J6V01_08575 [Clostridia bacterium]|nr:hypothetical protein [Clostridia bacterium]